MRKPNESRTDRKKLLTMAIAATLVMSTLTIGMPIAATAAPPKSVSAGSGEGTIFYSAHRIPDSHWDPCFAEECDQGKGPGTWIWFVLYNDVGEPIPLTDNLANEDGVFITGLDIGRTYFLQPTDCEDPNCGPPPHDVRFNNWDDCSTNQQKPFAITSSTTRSAAAYYRYHLHGEPDEPVACYTSSGSSSPPTNDPPTSPSEEQPPSGGGNPSSPPVASNGRTINVAWADIDRIVDLRKLVIPATELATLDGENSNSTNTNSTDIAAFVETTIAAQDIPDISLSGVPLGPDERVITYNSVYDIAAFDPDGLIQAMELVRTLGIDWNDLTDNQKAYVILTMQYDHPITSADIPSTNLSGLPLGDDGRVVQYQTLYDVAGSNPTELIMAMQAADKLRVDWNDLTDNQKAYMIVVLGYGEPKLTTIDEETEEIDSS